MSIEVKLLKYLDEKLSSYGPKILRGNVADFAEYKDNAGYYRALEDVRAEFVDLCKQARTQDDDAD